VKRGSAFLRDWLPPVVVRGLSALAGRGTRFASGFGSWDEARLAAAGYGDQAIVERTLAAVLRVIDGEAEFERDSVLFRTPAYEWPVLAALLRSAARRQGRLHVLDFGGGLGSSYFQHRRLLSGLPELRWRVVEQAGFCAAGRAHIHDPVLSFHDSIDDCLASGPVTVVLASGVLQYLPDPHAMLLRMCELEADTVVIDRTIVNSSGQDRLHVQHVSPAIYPGSYPCWSLSESCLLATAGSIRQLDASFDSLPFPELARIGSVFRGYIFTAGC
jgi:putative methyltransferase (TIGR04325 family)